MSTPVISVLLPTYNGASRIRQAIASVQAQTFQSWELLVIDDGSTDGTAEIVRTFALHDPRIQYVKNDTNMGIQKTLNRGMQLAQGNCIARIDDDDVWIDDTKLAQQVRFFEENADHVLVGTGVVLVDENGQELVRYLVPNTDADIRKKILGKNCFVHSSVLFKKDAALSFGGYDETQATRHVEDYDLWLRLGTIGKYANLPIYSVRLMQRADGLSARNKIEQFKKNIQLAKKYKYVYSGYRGALVRSWARIILYGSIFQLPLKYFFYKGMRWYKERW